MSDVQRRILQDRKFIVLHSYVYYKLGESLVPDSVFDRVSRDLVILQKDHPEDSLAVDFYLDYFKDWDGSTGFDIPFQQPEIDAAKKAVEDSY